MKSFIYSFVGYQSDDVDENDLQCNGHMFVSAPDREEADTLFKKALAGADDEYILMLERNIDENGNFQKDCVFVEEIIPGKNFSYITFGG
jgi:hypothetical protein